jgi:hypothetical protein
MVGRRIHVKRHSETSTVPGSILSTNVDHNSSPAGRCLQCCVAEFRVGWQSSGSSWRVLQYRAFSVATQCTVSTGKRANFREECHWAHACKIASSEHAWDPMASSSVSFCRKTRTVQPPVRFNTGSAKCSGIREKSWKCKEDRAANNMAAVM